MALTPLDIHNKEFRKAFRGYDEEEVDEYLDVIVREYEKVFKENIDLKEALAAKDANIGQYQDLEDTLKKTLVMAQQAAEELRQSSAREAEVVLKEARLKGEQLIAAAEEKAQLLLRGYEDTQKQAVEFKVKFRAFLRGQLELLGANEDLRFLDFDALSRVAAGSEPEISGGTAAPQEEAS